MTTIIHTCGKTKINKKNIEIKKKCKKSNWWVKLEKFELKAQSIKRISANRNENSEETLFNVIGMSLKKM